jgi:hypothetical protein
MASFDPKMLAGRYYLRRLPKLSKRESLGPGVAAPLSPSGPFGRLSWAEGKRAGTCPTKSPGRAQPELGDLMDDRMLTGSVPEVACMEVYTKATHWIIRHLGVGVCVGLSGCRPRCSAWVRQV